MSLDQPPAAVPPQTRAGSVTAWRVTPSPDPIPVLAAAVDVAIATLAPTAPPGQALETMLAGFAASVSSVQADIAILAARNPHGPLRIAQGYLGNAFTHAVVGDVEATRAALIAARATLFHLGGAADDGDVDWRS